MAFPEIHPDQGHDRNILSGNRISQRLVGAQDISYFQRNLTISGTARRHYVVGARRRLRVSTLSSANPLLEARG
jgi:hypothetical protein